jgi:hypothetical protein
MSNTMLPIMEGFNVEDILDKSKYKVIVQKTLKTYGNCYRSQGRRSIQCVYI